MARGCLNERIVADLEVKKRIQRAVDQRVREGVQLQDRAVGEMDIEQALQRALDMGEHIGGRHQLPGMTPGVVDAQECFRILIPCDEREMI